MFNQISSKQKILQIINARGKASPFELETELGLGRAMIHRHLKALLTTGDLTKVGTPPTVFYVPKAQIARPIGLGELDQETKIFLDQNYLYLTADGSLLSGVEALATWAQISGQKQSLESLAQEYLSQRKLADGFYNSDHLIDATAKISQTFAQNYLDKLFYLDFYSLPKFGKTRLGTLVLHAKLTQNKPLIKELAQKSLGYIQKLIDQYQIEALGFIPHSIPRNVPFLKYFQNYLSLALPVIDLTKAYAGQIPVAQKTLGSLTERITNAQETIFLKSASTPYRRILLIDDAVGSGATLNETAQKLKKFYQVEFVVGLSLVGSMKGFEVIREV